MEVWPGNGSRPFSVDPDFYPRLVRLCRFYRVPAQEVLSWSPVELALNEDVVREADAEFARRIQQVASTPKSMVFPVVILNPW